MWDDFVIEVEVALVPRLPLLASAYEHIGTWAFQKEVGEVFRARCWLNSDQAVVS
jgi:hypothetical protein